MNKKALENEETMKYKMEKEPEMGSSHTVSTFFIVTFFLIVILVVLFNLTNVTSNIADSDNTTVETEVQK